MRPPFAWYLWSLLKTRWRWSLMRMTWQASCKPALATYFVTRTRTDGLGLWFACRRSLQGKLRVAARPMWRLSWRAFAAPSGLAWWLGSVLNWRRCSHVRC